jgi:hypothetical protein
MAKIGGVYRNRFGPAEVKKEKANRAQGINVADGIPSQSSGILGGWIAEKQGHSSMGIFMDGDREKKNRDFYDPLCNVS